LLAVVDLLDPEPTRTELRRGVHAEDGEKVAKFCDTLDGSALPPTYAVTLGSQHWLGYKKRLLILKAAWKSHPDSLPIALLLTMITTKLWYDSEPEFQDTLKAESIGWGRLAVALRPDNPLAHFRLAIAFGFLDFDKSSLSPAADELRRTIQLAPRFAKAYAYMGFILCLQKNFAEAAVNAQKAIELDERMMVGHRVRFQAAVGLRDFKGAVTYRRQMLQLSRLDSDGDTTTDIEHNFNLLFATIDLYLCEKLIDGLFNSNQPYSAFLFFREERKTPYPGQEDPYPHPTFGSFFDAYTATCAAVLAGTGQGLDAPPPAERLAIRKYALEWLTTCFDAWNRQATVLPTLGASTIGLSLTPGFDGALLALAALHARMVDEASHTKHIAAVYDTMNRWLKEPHLSAVREETLLAQLPQEEQEQWRQFWIRVRALRDRTAPRK
jgi:hypothetical protein